MKVERHPGLRVETKQSVAPATSSGEPQRSFATALRTQRQRLTADDSGSQRRANSSFSKSRRPETAERNKGSGPPAKTASDRPVPSAYRPPALHNVPSDEEISLTDRAHVARWQRSAAARQTPCIEVVHAATGSRFLLSRQDGVWVLAMRSRVSLQEDDDFVEALRNQFAERGLGALDVVKL